MKLADTVKDRQLFGRCGLLPEHDELKYLSVGNYIRLKTKTGNCFWARILNRRGNRFICRLDDAVPELERGALCSCSCSEIFGIV